MTGLLERNGSCISLFQAAKGARMLHEQMVTGLALMHGEEGTTMAGLLHAPPCLARPANSDLEDSDTQPCRLACSSTPVNNVRSGRFDICVQSIESLQDR